MSNCNAKSRSILSHVGFVKSGTLGHVFEAIRAIKGANIGVENAPGIGNIRFDYSGQSQMWSQNAIHDLIGIDRFRSTAENSFQITR